MNEEKKQQRQQQKNICNNIWSTKNAHRTLVNAARARSKQKNIEFTITHNDISIPTHCPVFGFELDCTRGTGRKPNSPSLDRINPLHGYIPNNVWVISDLANRMKQNATQEELVKFATWVYTNYEAGSKP